jgi:hypothetical protein
MDELILLVEREENPSPAGIMAAAVTAALATCVLFFAPAVFAQPASDSLGELLVGKAAFGDWRTDAPLVRRKITDLPPTYATRSASNPPRVIAKPASATPKVPPPARVVRRAEPRHRTHQQRVRSNHAHLVHRHRGARRPGHRATANRSGRRESGARAAFPVRQPPHRRPGAGCCLPGDHWRRSALRRHGPHRPQPDPHGMVLHRFTGAATQLCGPDRALSRGFGAHPQEAEGIARTSHPERRPMSGGDFPKRHAGCTTERSSAAQSTARPRPTRPRNCTRKGSSFTRCPCCRTSGTDQRSHEHLVLTGASLAHFRVHC